MSNPRKEFFDVQTRFHKDMGRLVDDFEQITQSEEFKKLSYGEKEQFARLTAPYKKLADNPFQDKKEEAETIGTVLRVQFAEKGEMNKAYKACSATYSELQKFINDKLPNSKMVTREQQPGSSRPVSISGELIKPIQNLPRYGLLLRDMGKKTNDASEAEKIQTLTKFMDQNMKATEEFVEQQEAKKKKLTNLKAIPREAMAKTIESLKQERSMLKEQSMLTGSEGGMRQGSMEDSGYSPKMEEKKSAPERAHEAVNVAKNQPNPESLSASSVLVLKHLHEQEIANQSKQPQSKKAPMTAKKAPMAEEPPVTSREGNKFASARVATLRGLFENPKTASQQNPSEDARKKGKTPKPG